VTPCPRCGVRMGDEHGTLGRADEHEVPCGRHPGGRECPTMPCGECQAGVGRAPLGRVSKWAVDGPTAQPQMAEADPFRPRRRPAGANGTGAGSD